MSRIRLPLIDTEADREHDREVQRLIDALAAERRSRPAENDAREIKPALPTKETPE